MPYGPEPCSYCYCTSWFVSAASTKRCPEDCDGGFEFIALFWFGNATESSYRKVTDFVFPVAFLPPAAAPELEDSDPRFPSSMFFVFIVYISYNMKFTLRSTAVFGAKNSSILKGGIRLKSLLSILKTFFMNA